LAKKASRETLPKINQVAVFDTSFHSTIPSHRYRYAIPDKYYEIYKIRKYGFHGTSFKYVTKKAQEILGKDSKMIICHLGNGSSICAIENGKSIDTSMGFTPLQGIIMGTRCGDIDPSIIVEIEKREKISGENVIKILNKESGLKALCGDSDMRLIRERILSNDKKAEIAFKELSESVTKYLAYYTALLNGTDAIVFTGGIGENAYYLRADILKHFEHMGLKIDSKKNEKNEQEISAKGSKVKVLVIPTNEELMIAQDTEKICKTIKNKEH
jgi:acetate kinase